MSTQPKRFYEFGPFRVDLLKRLLLRDGEPVSLKPKVFETLLVLLEARGQVLGKDELLKKLWPDSIVEESNLNVYVSLLRKALGESPNDRRYIVTIPGRGYSFVAEVSELQSERAELIVHQHTRSSLTIEEEIETNGSDEAQAEIDLALSQRGDVAVQSFIQDWEFEAKGKCSILPDARNKQAEIETVKGPAASTEEEKATPAKSIDSYQVSEIKRHKRGVLRALTVLVITAVGIALGLYLFIGQNRQTAPFQAMKIAKLTTTGKVGASTFYTAVAISPDGKYVAHVIEDAGQRSLWVRQIAASGSVQILPSAEVEYLWLAFSNDGNHVYYLVRDKKMLQVLYLVPVLGGASRRLIERINTQIALSSDGKRFAFVRRDPETGEGKLIVANVDGTEEQILATRLMPEVWGPLAWSPDGKTIACVVITSAGGVHSKLIVVQIKDGTERLIPSSRWENIGGLAWLADGRSLVIVAREQMSLLAQLWQLSYPSGEARRITNDLNDYHGLSLTADSATLVTVRTERLFNIWIAPLGEASRAKQVTSDNCSGSQGLSWTSEGRLVYESQVSGQGHLWLMDVDGSRNRPLTVGDHCNFYPAISPDGRFIVFLSNRTLTQNVWRMDIDGDNPKRLTVSNIDVMPQCTPDGQWVIYSSLAPDRMTLWKAPIDGGEPVQLIDKYSTYPRISPDGKLLAYRSSSSEVTITPFEGGEPMKVLNLPFSVVDQKYCWMPDSQALVYGRTKGGVSNLWSQPIDGSPPKQLTDFRADRIFSFDWSRDGKQLALSRGTVSSDVVMLSDSRELSPDKPAHHLP